MYFVFRTPKYSDPYVLKGLSENTDKWIKDNITYPVFIHKVIYNKGNIRRIFKLINTKGAILINKLPKDRPESNRNARKLYKITLFNNRIGMGKIGLPSRLVKSNDEFNEMMNNESYDLISTEFQVRRIPRRWMYQFNSLLFPIHK